VEKGEEFDRSTKLKILRHPAFESPGAFFKLFNALVHFLYALMLILFFKVRLIHAGQIWVSGSIALIFKKILGIPYILWVYGGETTPVYMGSPITTRWAKTILYNAEKIITNSQFCQKEFLAFGFLPEDCLIVLPGVDTGIFTPNNPLPELARRWNPQRKKVLLTVARLSERKGHDLVLKALPEILKKHHDTLYLIVGKGPDQERLEKIVSELSLKENVKFAGFAPDEELPDYYRLCDIYVMPNREITQSTDSIEGFGISFIEASACGKPCVGGKSGGAVEAVAEGVSGYLVEPDSVEEFASVVIKLLNDDELRSKLGIQGRQRVEREMDWRTRAEIIKKVENICILS
jgi:phosphatidylinositol alpha-1,6-mannosyltransferase